jgi:hypothetical protein
MTHDELAVRLYVLPADVTELQHGRKAVQALHKIVALHTPEGNINPQQCSHDKKFYPCPTIQIIEKELQ